jgi:hypothetical protein
MYLEVKGSWLSLSLDVLLAETVGVEGVELEASVISAFGKRRTENSTLRSSSLLGLALSLRESSTAVSKADMVGI